MAGAKTATITYVQTEVDADAPVPATWYFGVRDTTSGGEAVPEQTFATPVPTVTFAGIPTGTFEVWAGQRAADGAPVGDIVKSAPFEVKPNVVITVVGTITITTG